MHPDHALLRDLARQYAALAADPVQEQRRRLWADSNSLRPTRVPVLCMMGTWDAWLGAHVRDSLRCQDPFLRELETSLRTQLLLASFGDDRVFEPWLGVGPVQPHGWNNLWGVAADDHHSGQAGGAFTWTAPIRTWDDLAKLTQPGHIIDRPASETRWRRAEDVLGDVLPIDRFTGPFCTGFKGDIATDIAKLRGLEQVMIDMVDDPEGLGRLLAFMRDGIVANQHQAAASGDYRRTGGNNQGMPYCHELPWPAANTPCERRHLWYHVAAQEFTGVSPKLHDRHLLEYQLPILAPWGLVTYGCCEDLTRKIDMLRRIPNLRTIAVAPTANVARCAEQIGTSYVLSWRPSPTDTVCGGWNEARCRQVLRDGIAASRGTHRHILLKDVHTVQGEPERVRRFCAIARELSEEAWTRDAPPQAGTPAGRPPMAIPAGR